MTEKLKFSKEFFLSLILTAFALFLAFFGGYGYAVTDGLKLWACVIIPSLYPYFFITAVLSKFSTLERAFIKFSPVTKRLFGTGGITAYAFFMSALSGYPIGAKIICDLKNNGLISSAEGTKACVFCSTSSPAFTVTCVGKIMANSTIFGVILYAINILCALFSGVVFSLFIKGEKSSYSFSEKPLASSILYDCVYQSVISILVVGGIMALFSLISEVLLSLGVLFLPAKLLSFITGDFSVSTAWCVGLLESTTGLKLLFKNGITFFALPISAFVCGFGGVSVLLQSVAFLNKANIKTAPFLLGKIVQAVCGFVLGILFSVFFF